MSEIWPSTKVGDCCDILDNLRVPLNAEERADIQGNIPYYGANGLQGYIDKFIFDEPLILLAEDGGYFDEYESRPIAYRIRGKSWVNNHAHILRTKVGGSFSQDFVFYCLEHKNLMPFIKGGTRAKLNQAELREILIQKPPEPIQRRIAEILSTVDKAIEQTEALIAKYQQIKAGLMHDLFTRGLFPEASAKGDVTWTLRPTYTQAPHLYRESPLGWIPKEWEVKRLGAILKQCGGYLQTGPFGTQLHAHEYQHEGVPVVMPQDINDGVISTDQIARIVERKAEELSRHRMRVGDIVIARRGELSRAAAIVESHEGWLCGTGCFLLRLGRNALHSDFAACVYRHDLIQRQIAGMAVGTTMPSLNNTVMERLFFPFCNPEEQSRIIERLDNLDQFLRYIQYQALKLRQQKHGLMHDLLTGRVRVNVAEPAST